MRGLIFRAKAEGSLSHSETDCFPSRSSARRKACRWRSINTNLWPVFTMHGKSCDINGITSLAVSWISVDKQGHICIVITLQGCPNEQLQHKLKSLEVPCLVGLWTMNWGSSRPQSLFTASKDSWSSSVRVATLLEPRKRPGSGIGHDFGVKRAGGSEMNVRDAKYCQTSARASRESASTMRTSCTKN
jgi:hypothetical protein